MSPEEVAWVAGIIEGEGCFTVRRHKHAPKYLYGTVAVQMTDHDIVLRLQALTGVGRVSTPNQDNRSNRKRIFVWQVQKSRDVEWLIKTVLPWLGERRSLRAREVLAGIADWQTRNRSITPSGRSRIAASNRRRASCPD